VVPPVAAPRGGASVATPTSELEPSPYIVVSSNPISDVVVDVANLMATCRVLRDTVGAVRFTAQLFSNAETALVDLGLTEIRKILRSQTQPDAKEGDEEAIACKDLDRRGRSRAMRLAIGSIEIARGVISVTGFHHGKLTLPSWFPKVAFDVAKVQRSLVLTEPVAPATSKGGGQPGSSDSSSSPPSSSDEDSGEEKKRTSRKSKKRDSPKGGGRKHGERPTLSAKEIEAMTK
jgi:hypothetical protein